MAHPIANNDNIFITNSKNNTLEIPLRSGKLSCSDLKKAFPEVRALFLVSAGIVKMHNAKGNSFYPPEKGWESYKLFVASENESVNDLPCFSKPKCPIPEQLIQQLNIEQKEAAVPDRKRIAEPEEIASQSLDPKRPRISGDPIIDEKEKKIEYLKNSAAFEYPSELSQLPKQKDEFLQFRDVLFRYLPKSILKFDVGKYKKNFLWKLRGVILSQRNLLLKDFDPKYETECSLCGQTKFTIRHLFEEEHLKNVVTENKIMSRQENSYVSVTDSKNHTLQILLKKGGKLSSTDLTNAFAGAKALILFSNSKEMDPLIHSAIRTLYHPPENGWKSYQVFVLCGNETEADFSSFSNRKRSAEQETMALQPLEPKRQKLSKETLSMEKLRKLENLKNSPAFAYPSDIQDKKDYSRQKTKFLQFRDRIFHYLPNSILTVETDMYKKHFCWHLRGLILNPKNFLMKDFEISYATDCDLCLGERFTIRHLFSERHLRNRREKRGTEPRGVLLVFSQVLRRNSIM